MQSFNNSTINPERFYIENVLSDDACFYRAIANSINYQYKFKDNVDSVFNKLGEWIETKDYENIGLEIGFSVVKSGPLVRSSYQADECV